MPLRLALLTLLLANIVLAQSFVTRRYTPSVGLPSAYIFDVVQDQQGYLWVATDKGIASYDGRTFRTYGVDEGLPTSQVYSITPTKKDGLWLGTYASGAVYFDGQRFRIHSRAQGLPSDQVFHVEVDRHGTAYFLTKQHLIAWDGEQYHSKPISARASHYDHLGRLPDGRILYATDKALVSALFIKGAWHTTIMNDTVKDPFNRGITRFAWQQDTLWVVNSNIVKAYLYTGGKLALLRKITVKGRLLCMAASPTALWVANQDGQIFEILAGSKQARQVSFPEFSFVQALCRDYEGQMWVGDFGSGLYKLQPNYLTSYTWLTEPSEVHPLPGGNILLADVTGMGMIRADGSTQRYLVSGWSRPQHVHLHADSLWIATLIGLHGPLPFSAFLQGVQPPFLSEGNGIGTVMHWQGKVYMGLYGGGLRTLQDGKLVYPAGLPQALKLEMVESLRASSTTLWALTLEHGIHRYDGKQWQHLSRQTGMPTNVFWAMYTEGDTLWAAYKQGVVKWWPGGKTILSYAQGKMPSVVRRIFRDGRGRLWMVSDSKLYRLLGTRWHPYSSLPLQQTQQETIVCTGYLPAEDRLVLGTPLRILSLHPGRLPHYGVPPRVALEQVVLNGQPLTPQKGELILPPSFGSLLLSFGVHSLLDEQLNAAEVRIPELGPEWIEVDNDLSLRYESLPPGTYTVWVRGQNALGIYSAPRVLLRIVVEAPYYLKPWFWVLLLLLAIGLGILLAQAVYRQRLTRERRRLALQQALEQERSRISRDLHDHMGAHLSYMITQLDLLPPQMKGPATEELNDALRQSMQMLRETIWVLHGSQIHLDELVDKIRFYSQRRLQGLPTRLYLQHRATPRILKPDVVLHLYRLVQEAVNNAAKYAQAELITILLEDIPGGLKIEIVDDGCGFDAEKTEGYGLENMKRRAEELGGTLLLTTAPGQGTRLEIIVPLPV